MAGPIRGNADAHFAQNVNVAGDLTAARSIITPKLSSDTVDAGTVNFTGDLEVAQTIRGNADAHFAKNVNVAGDLTASRSIITPKLSSDTVEAGKVNVGGDLGVAGPIRGNADAHFAKNVNVAGDLTASRSIITPKLSIDTVDAEKVSVGGDLEVAQTIRGNADAYFHGNVHVAGHLTAAGGIRKVPDEVLASDRVEISSITTATIWVDMRDMGMTIFTKHSRIFILRFHAGGVRGIAPAALFSSASMRAEFRLLVDDSQHAYCMNEVNQKFGDSGSGLPDISLEKFLRLGEGSHTVKVQWSVRSPQARDRLWWAGTNIFGLSYSRWLFERRCHLSISCNDNTRSLTVLEL
ncbi:MAG: hypothetical protein GY835_05165 [bacterium]|nr:hypothetical protein [bacterium]